MIPHYAQKGSQSPGVSFIALLIIDALRCIFAHIKNARRPPVARPWVLKRTREMEFSQNFDSLLRVKIFRFFDIVKVKVFQNKKKLISEQFFISDLSESFLEG